MGYNTDFYGCFKLNKKLDKDTMEFLNKFHNTRRMKRDMSKLFPNEDIEKFGVDGEFFVDGTGDFGQGNDVSIVNYNEPPSTQPSLWCQWIPTDDGMSIEWDGGEKAYEMDKWITYLIDKILKPRGYVLNGEVSAQGEEFDDRWQMIVKDNVLTIKTLD